MSCTTFLITQKISSTVSADLILLLDEGRLIAQGTHKELMDASPLYRKIYQSQTGRRSMFKALIEPFRHPKLEVGLGEGKVFGAMGARKPKAKAKNWSGTLGRIWSYLAERRAKLLLVLFMVLLSSGLSLLGPYLISRAVDHYLEGDGGRTWVIFLVTLALVYLLNSLISWLQNIWMIEIAQETVYRMRTDLFSHLHRLPISFFNRRQQGRL